MRSIQTTKPQAGRKERIDLSYDYAVCAWARHFNVSEKKVKEAVAAVGDDADRVREHLQKASPRSERPSSH
jgi:predicted nucleotidyltransferase